jgi:hypothetical protein
MTMFAIILMVYGLYRFIMTLSKMKQIKLEEKRQLLNEEKENLLDRS